MFVREQRGSEMKTILRNILGYGSLAVFIGGVFWAAGRLDWWPGWAFIAIVTVGYVGQNLFNWLRNPEVINRRGEIGEGTKAWDKICLAFFGLSFITVPIVGALDAGRFGWSSMPWWCWFIGAAFFAFHILTLAWAMDANPFFEKTVRIQTDRGHHVADTGPYRIVRHPGYSSNIVGVLFGWPFLLLSWWAFLPAIFCALTLIVRTVLEDRTLQAELEGYKEYAQRTRYRLFPGIW